MSADFGEFHPGNNQRETSVEQSGNVLSVLESVTKNPSFEEAILANERLILLSVVELSAARITNPQPPCLSVVLVLLLITIAITFYSRIIFSYNVDEDKNRGNE